MANAFDPLKSLTHVTISYSFIRLVKLCAFPLTMLFACWHGNAKRAAFPLIMIGLCGLLSDLPLASILMIGGPIVIAWFWFLQPSRSQ